MTYYAVYQDGARLRGGLGLAEAERYADYLARGFESHCAGTKRRVAEFNVKPDKALNDDLERNWKTRGN